MLIKSVTKSVNKPTSRTPLGNPCLLLVHWMESCPTVMVGSWDFNDFLICGGIGARDFDGSQIPVTTGGFEL